jgi:FkbM family methyltransferase
MDLKKILLFFYKKLSYIYVFIFGRKKMQFLNDIFLSLTLNAKGYKNYGSFKETGEEKFIKKISDDLFFCIDIGANIGKYTELLLKETAAKIIAFEPLPDAYLDLKKIELSNLNRLKVFNQAIGEKNEFLELNYASRKSEKASFSDHLEKISFYDFHNNKKIKMKILTLDTFIEENLDDFNQQKIDLIKIDTEGFELEVIKGATKTIKKMSPKYIQLEFNWHQLFKKQNMYSFSEFLKNYEVFQILPYGNDLVKVNVTRPEANIYHLSNFVYIRKDISSKF